MMEQTGFTVGDIGVVVVLLLSGLLALSRGLVKEAFALAAWVGGALIALWAFPLVRPFALDFIPIPWAAEAATAIGLFILGFIAISLISRPITSRVRDSDLRPLDRSLGFLFGLLRGAALISLVYLLMLWLWQPIDHPDWVRNARSLPLVERGTKILQLFIPDEAARMGEDAASDAERQIRKGQEAREAIETLDSLTREAQEEAEGETPGQAQGQAEDDQTGYDARTRNQMDRLNQQLDATE
ncbi:MAG: CvpA family protein [Rhodospirillaceae bacterium]|jgi:membrane protein required for colicin V production|nr:CvpA family protein [Rhodospirillaceae bacterium]MBT6118519.1 CvpA family protein [Rhodospirillaceae bacterium]